MAKKQLRKYVFTPGNAGVAKIVVQGYWSAERLLLITNITRGVIYYNFADTSNTPASVGWQPGGIKTSDADDSVITYGRDVLGRPGSAKIQSSITGVGETTITLNSNLAVGHNANDVLSILVEENYQYTRPWSDFGTDAIERTRTANPQSMIDADFEYGLQPTKWTSFELVNQYPSVYEQVGPDLVVTEVETDDEPNSLITVTTSGSHNLKIGDPITVSAISVDAEGFGKAQGAFLIYTVPSPSSFTYYAKGQVSPVTGDSIRDPRTQIRRGGIYTGADLPVSFIETDGANPSLITLTFASPHGFTPGMPLLVNANPSWGSNVSLTSLPGSYFANAIVSSNKVTFLARGQVNPAGSSNIGNLMVTNTAGIKVYPRPDGFFTHRPGDGGILLGTNSTAHGASAVRQSKKYFRYQSGKGLLYTTGVLFAPNYDIVEVNAVAGDLTAATGIVEVKTSVPHGLQIGAKVRIRGVATEGYDGTYDVETIIDETTIRASAIDDLGAADGSVVEVPKLYIFQWHGACLRTGPHDDANGMFFEYDGQNFNVCRRTSTLQLAGTVTITPNSNRLLGNNTLWSAQLKIGDKIVVKGMVHKVTSVLSDEQITVNPDFRGANSSSGNYIYRIEETRIKQSDFNLDTVDGSGNMNNPSGYKMDPNHMQMVGIQFSWYGAGFMDFMVRGHDANFIILHRMKQNNINTTASMRSANLPVRYEVINEGAGGVTAINPLGSALAAGATSGVVVTNVDFYPPSGFVLIENELIRYNSVDRSNPQLPRLAGLIRNATSEVFVGGTLREFSGISDSVSHGTGVGVELVSLTATPNMSHWGSSYIIDGGFDYDRGYQFTYTVPAKTIDSTDTTVLALRLSPSASNSTVGDLGDRELLNRAQILLSSIEVACSDGRSAAGNVSVLVTGILNPSNYDEANQTWATLNNQEYGNQPSFSQVTSTFSFTTGSAASPGETIFQFVYDPRQKQTLDLTQIKELSQSAIGGRGTFPNGADTLFINMRALVGGSTLSNVAQVHTTIQWAEAQA